MIATLVEHWGAIGAVAGLLLYTIKRLFDLLMKSMDARIEEKSATLTALNECTSALQQLTLLVKETRRRE